MKRLLSVSMIAALFAFTACSSAEKNETAAPAEATLPTATSADATATPAASTKAPAKKKTKAKKTSAAH